MAYYADKNETPRFASAVSDTRLEKEFERAHSVAVQVLDVWHEIARVLKVVAAPIARAQRIRKTEHVLHGLSDRQLSDIGIYREEIAAVARDCETDRIGQRTV